MPETPQLMPSKNGSENTFKNQDGSMNIFFVTFAPWREIKIILSVPWRRSGVA